MSARKAVERQTLPGPTDSLEQANARWSRGDGYPLRRAVADVRYGERRGDEDLSIQMISGSLLWDDAPITPDTCLYVDFPACQAWDGVRAEDFDAHVNLLVELRNAMFKSSGCTLVPFVHTTD